MEVANIITETIRSGHENTIKTQQRAVPAENLKVRRPQAFTIPTVFVETILAGVCNNVCSFPLSDPSSPDT